MHIQIKGQVLIDVSAEKAWRVLAHDYGQIGQWATAIAASETLTASDGPREAPCSGRVCNAPGFGKVRENFTYYDEAGMRFGYIATSGLPGFITHAENNWTVRALADNQCEATFRGEIDLAWLPGLFMAPLFKFQMKRLTSQTAEELKYFLEHDQPHPRKQKQLQMAAA